MFRGLLTFRIPCLWSKLGSHRDIRVRPSSYLTWRAGGFAFRLIVPVDFRPRVGSQIIKRALRTRDRILAHAFVLAFAEQYARDFRNPPGK